MIPTVQIHGLNCMTVEVAGIKYLFSYTTCVGFDDGSGWRVCQNIWSDTTGKHMRITGVDRRDRIPREEFLSLLEKVSA